VVVAPQEASLPATQLEAIPHEQEEKREGLEVVSRKAQALRKWTFSLHRIATQQLEWHPSELGNVLASFHSEEQSWLKRQSMLYCLEQKAQQNH
jgi:hypothetical protein